MERKSVSGLVGSLPPKRAESLQHEDTQDPRHHSRPQEFQTLGNNRRVPAESCLRVKFDMEPPGRVS